MKFGAIVTDGVKKIGGHVVQSNHYGRFLRTRVSPAVITNTYTTAQRANLVDLNNLWKSITESQREAWIAATPDFPRQNAFGDTYYPSGKNLFMWLNRNLFVIGTSPNEDPPAVDIPSANLSFTLDVNTGVFPVNITPVTPAEFNSQYIAVYATRGLSVGINYVSSEYRLLGYFVGSGASDYALDGMYIDKYHTIDSGTKVFMKLIAISKTSGQHGVAYTAKCIVP